MKRSRDPIGRRKLGGREKGTWEFKKGRCSRKMGVDKEEKTKIIALSEWGYAGLHAKTDTKMAWSDLGLKIEG